MSKHKTSKPLDKNLASWLTEQATALTNLEAKGNRLKLDFVQNARDRGKILLEVQKRLVGASQRFEIWVSENTDIGYSTALLFMDVARNFDLVKEQFADSNALELTLREVRDAIRDARQERGEGKPGSGRTKTTATGTKPTSRPSYDNIDDARDHEDAPDADHDDAQDRARWEPTHADAALQPAALTYPDSFIDQIIVGDVLTTMRHIPNGSVDLVVTSPPYNLRNSTGGGMKKGKRGMWTNAALADGYADHDDCMPHDEYVKWQRACLTEMLRVIPEHGAIFYNHKWRVQHGLIQDRRDILEGFPVRQIIIWKRQGGFNFNPGYFLPTYEVIYLLAKPGFRLAPKANSHGDVWDFAQEPDSPHPAPFPVALTDRIISTTNAEIILDPFMGSGTTALSARHNNRHFIGIEKSQCYVDLANRRLDDQQSALRHELGGAATSVADIQQPMLHADGQGATETEAGVDRADMMTLNVPAKAKALADALMAHMRPKKVADLLRNAAKWVHDQVERDARRDLPGQGYLFPIAEEVGADSAAAA
jgi:site-specific DNA-methyltransferase (adenine-specific)